MKRYKHNLSNTRLTTCDMGQLIPVGLTEALPGDTFQLGTSAMIRVSPLAAPVMHPVNVRIHHFFVPHRLAWDAAVKTGNATGSWEDFITGGPDGRDASLPPVGPVKVGPAVKKTLYDYFGFPVNSPDDTGFGVEVNQMPLIGYNLIWNEYFRDQDLQSEVTIQNVQVLNIGWGKDYFTTARPWTQKGPEVTLPLGSKAPVVGIGSPATFNYNAPNADVFETGKATSTLYAHGAAVFSTSPAQGLYIKGTEAGTAGRPEIYADLSAAGAININDFRRAFAIQRYQEARARYGSRYTEYLRYLGVTPSDARLQRPEYIGGGTARLNFSEVLQTAQANRDGGDGGYGVGDLYGHGVAGVRSGRVRRFIEEHGFVFTLLSVRPRGLYMNGIHRSWFKRTKEDYWQKELEQIGQQAILRGEIYAEDATPSDAYQTFGYQDRYSEYKSQPSLVTGEFRDILDFWHMGRKLPPSTQLNEEFIKCVPTKRIHNVQTQDALWCQINNRVVARRMVRKSGSSRIM